MRKKTAFVIVLHLVALITLPGTCLAASVKGKVSFDGTPPVLEQMKMDADPQCLAQHPQGVPSEQVVVNAGALANVFVYVKEGLGDRKFPTPEDPVVLDQKGCHYIPHIFGIRTGQPLQIVNSDPTLHNVHALPAKSPPFNLGMPIQGMKLIKKFAASEVMVKIKCDVHPWMSGYAGVLDHPFFAVTDADGNFELKDLPPGDYVIEAWHEKYGTKTRNVAVAADGETKEAAFSFNG